MSDNIDEYTITLGDLLQAFACSMCKHKNYNEPCKYCPESNKELCKHFKAENNQGMRGSITSSDTLRDK